MGIRLRWIRALPKHTDLPHSRGVIPVTVFHFTAPGAFRASIIPPARPIDQCCELPPSTPVALNAFVYRLSIHRFLQLRPFHLDEGPVLGELEKLRALCEGRVTQRRLRFVFELYQGLGGACSFAGGHAVQSLREFLLREDEFCCENFGADSTASLVFLSAHSALFTGRSTK